MYITICICYFMIIFTNNYFTVQQYLNSFTLKDISFSSFEKLKIDLLFNQL